MHASSLELRCARLFLIASLVLTGTGCAQLDDSSNEASDEATAASELGRDHGRRGGHHRHGRHHRHHRHHRGHHGHDGASESRCEEAGLPCGEFCLGSLSCDDEGTTCDEPGWVTVCHRTGNHHRNTITVSSASLHEHLVHGDIIGTCNHAELLPINGCGGCQTLDGEPGTACGDDDAGTWVCDGTDSVNCVMGDPGGGGGGGGGCEVNECGGPCVEGEGTLGAPCGLCFLDQYICAEDGSIECSGDKRANPCGGCSELENPPGEPCGECGTGTWECAGSEATECVESTFPNCPR